MIKLVYCLRRKSGISSEEFQDYWKNQHGRFVASVAAKFGIQKYVQSHHYKNGLDAVMVSSRGTIDDPFDGVTEIWWESEEAFMAAASTAEGQELARLFVEDEANFVDFSRSVAFFTKEHIVVSPS